MEEFGLVCCGRFLEKGRWYVCILVESPSLYSLLRSHSSSAAGKSQLALQLSLMVQLPKDLRGLGGSACFLTTSASLPTSRLQEMNASHPHCSSGHCSLSNIHTVQAPDVASMIKILSIGLPNFIEEINRRPHAKPVKLLIIDTLAEIFHTESKTTSAYLSQRSKDLSQISTLLHTLVYQYDLAVIVINEVIESIVRPAEANQSPPGEVLFHDQARLFGSSNDVPGGSKKQASLGLVWANQINVRIMLSLTQRICYLDDVEASNRPKKRARLDEGIKTQVTDRTTRIRRLNVVFNTVAPPAFVDYIVTVAGIQVIPGELIHVAAQDPQEVGVRGPLKTSPRPPHGVMPLDLAFDEDLEITPEGTFVGEITGDKGVKEAEDGPMEKEDEWEQYWKDSLTEQSGVLDISVQGPPSSSSLI